MNRQARRQLDRLHQKEDEQQWQELRKLQRMPVEQFAQELYNTILQEHKAIVELFQDSLMTTKGIGDTRFKCVLDKFNKKYEKYLEKH